MASLAGLQMEINVGDRVRYLGHRDDMCDPLCTSAQPFGSRWSLKIGLFATVVLCDGETAMIRFDEEPGVDRVCKTRHLILVE